MRIAMTVVLALLTVPAAADIPVLQLFAHSKADRDERTADPAQADQVSLDIHNAGTTPATNLTFRATLPDGGTFVRVTDEIERCSVSPHEIVCNWPELELPPGWHLTFDFLYHAPDRNDGRPYRIVMETAATGTSGTATDLTTLTIPLRQRFVVTHGGNEGAGSLRQAIVDANAACASTRCVIAFATADVIRPATPLPQVSGYVKIDGGASRQELDGSLLREGHAIASDRPCELRLVNLRIHDFPGHAIDTDYDGAGCRAEDLLAAVYVQNNELWQNLRGVVAKVAGSVIAGNVIRDQRRAGIFLDNSYRAVVDRNTIINNGASGVFVNLSATELFYGLPPDARVTNNVIRNNREWGICRTPNGWVGVTGNEIADNLAHAIDIGLDLDTPNRPDAARGFPNKPILHSAHYDAANDRTILRGHLDPFSGEVDVYASRRLSGAGHPQAERLIATMRYDGPGSFELAIPGDYRGQWLTATSSQFHTPDWSLSARDTSEISRAVEVH